MAKKKNLRGIALAEQINYNRSARAKKVDASKRAKRVVPPTKKGIAEWKKDPGNIDIYSVDTPGYCQDCGKFINSKWKPFCYKCYHKRKKNYRANKLQKRHGGTK